MYRERFLIDKYTLDANEPTPRLADVLDIEELSAAEVPDDGSSGSRS